jgi:hypothetical protein
VSARLTRLVSLVRQESGSNLFLISDPAPRSLQPRQQAEVAFPLRSALDEGYDANGMARQAVSKKGDVVSPGASRSSRGRRAASLTLQVCHELGQLEGKRHIEYLEDDGVPPCRACAEHYLPH